MKTHAHRLGLLCAELFLHHLGIDPTHGPELGDLFKEIGLRDEEKREPRRKVVHVDADARHVLHEGLRVRQGKSDLVQRTAPGFRDVIAADIDGVVASHVARAIHDGVTHDAHARADRVDPLLLGRVLLQDVVLNGAGEFIEVVALLLRQRHVHRQQDPGARVDRHGDADLFEVYPLEERLHVVEHVDRHALAADLAPAHAVVGVVAHKGRHVEVHRQTGLPLPDQVLEALVGLGARAETGDLSHGPGPPAVHGRVGAAGERVASGQPDLLPGRVGNVRRRVDAFYGEPRAAEVLVLLLRHALQKAGQLVAFPIGDVVLYLPDDALLYQAGEFLAVELRVWGVHAAPFGSWG